MLISGNGQHPFTIARMTDHNVRGADGPAETTDDGSRAERASMQPTADRLRKAA